MKDRLKSLARKTRLLPLLYRYFVLNSGDIIRKAFLLGSEALTAGQKKFINVNSEKWRAFNNLNESRPNGRVLVNILSYQPTYMAANSVLSKYLERLKHLKPLFLMQNPYDAKSRKICASYGKAGFAYFGNRYRDPLIRLKSWGGAGRMLNNLRNGDDLINLKYDGILIGDLVYNSYIKATGEGTIDVITPGVIKYVREAALIRQYYSALFRKHDIKAVVTGEMFFLPYGLLARVALEHGAEVFVITRSPGNTVRVRRYMNPDDLGNHHARPPDWLVNAAREHRKTESIEKAEAYLQERMNPPAQKSGESDVTIAYDSSKPVLSKSELRRRLGIDEAKPVVVIMCHWIPDAPRSHGWSLFKDYLVWLRETLDFIKERPETNWLVKPHPYVGAPNPRHSGRSEIEKVTGTSRENTVRLLPEEINTRSLCGIADVIITARGTAGLEFACFGIPCILTGRSSYSGFGFTMEPRSKEEYFELLGAADRIKRLSPEQVEIAKVVAYLHFVLQLSETTFLPSGTSHAGKTDDDRLWLTLIETTQKADPLADPLYLNLERMLHFNGTHLLNMPEFFQLKAARV